MNSDCVLVVNLDKKGIKNYIGGNTFLEMGFTFVNFRDIFLYNSLPKSSDYLPELQAMQPIIINSDISKIKKYYSHLPQVYVASESRIKTQAASFGLRQIGTKTQIQGIKVPSNISREPLSFKEMYTGVFNRIQSLKKRVKKYFLLIAIESGMVKIENHYFDCALCVVENEKGNYGISLSSGVSIPIRIAKEVMDKKQELGIYLQKKFKVPKKDAFVCFSHGKINRQESLTGAVSIAYSQLIK